MTDIDDDIFTVSIRWTTTGMYQPVISIRLPDHMQDTSEGHNMLEFIGEQVRSRQDARDVEVLCRRGNMEDFIMFKTNKMHVHPPRKCGTPRAPAIIKWLINELPKYGVLPPTSRLRFKVWWSKNGMRAADYILDTTLGNP